MEAIPGAEDESKDKGWHLGEGVRLASFGLGTI
jgi:hypothetical protein